MPLLEIDRLQTHFRLPDGGVMRAVDGLTASVDEGEILAIVGESGCGKSVTSLSILGLIPPGAAAHGGQIRFRGRDLLSLPEPEMRRIRGREIAMIFQEPMTSLNPVFTVGRQIGESLRLHRGLTRAEADRAAVELLGQVGIPAPESRVGAYPHQLSGGMRQRVVIAMALACEPALLIADEPTTALDVTIQAQILDLIRDIRDRRRTAVIFITHDLGVVRQIADRVVVMYAGRKVEDCAADDLFAAPRHPYTAGLMQAMPRLGASRGGVRPEPLSEIPGQVPSLRRPPEGCRFAPRCASARPACARVDPALRPGGASREVACHYPLGSAA